MMYNMIRLKLGSLHWTHLQWSLAMPSGKCGLRESLKASALKSWWEQDNGDEVRSINKKMQLSSCQGPGITERKTISGEFVPLISRKSNVIWYLRSSYNGKRKLPDGRSPMLSQQLQVEIKQRNPVALKRGERITHVIK